MFQHCLNKKRKRLTTSLKLTEILTFATCNGSEWEITSKNPTGNISVQKNREVPEIPYIYIYKVE